MRKLIVVGAGGCGRDVMQWALDCAKAGATWEPIGFIDDNPNALKNLRASRPLLGSISDWQPAEDEVFVCGIATPEVKIKIVALLRDKGVQFTSLVHPTAIVLPTAEVGAGTVLSPFVVVSDNAVVGDFVFVNLHSAIGHDAEVGDYATICSYCDVTGGVVLGKETYLGSHVTVVPKVTVGDRAFVCAGSVVVNRVAPDTRVMGNPAKKFVL
jgi:sugar O-acyltransferase (sialic acid O-acetyltransferase NeuD family)